MPISSLIFIILIYCLYSLLSKTFNEKKGKIITSVIIIMILISPLVFKLKPEVLYTDKKEILEQFQNELNIPTVYLLDQQNSRFLDDILIFSSIDNSYVTKNIDDSIIKSKEILSNMDTSKGIVVFISENSGNENKAKAFCASSEFKEFTHLKKMNASNIYLCK